MISRKGFVLVFVISAVSILSLIAISYTTVASNELKMAAKNHDAMQAYYMAEAGIAVKMIQLKRGNAGSYNESFTGIPNSSGVVARFNTTVTPLSPNPYPLPAYNVTSVGRYRDVLKTISVVIRQVSIARYIYFTQEEKCYAPWPSPVQGWTNYFCTGLMLRGVIHTNDYIHIYQNPIFDGPVTSSKSPISYYHNGPPGDNPDFRDSVTLGVPEISMPATGTLLAPIIAGAAGGTDNWVLGGDTKITLLADGTMSVINNARYGDSLPHVEQLPSSGALYVGGGNVDVSGVLNGQLTIGTNLNINIVGSITYAQDPLTSPGSTDMLGLVAQRDAIITTAAPYNMDLYAYIVTLDGGLSTRDSETVKRGVLNHVGGMTSKRLGMMGFTNVTGYDVNMIYDERIGDTINPRYFPAATDSCGTLYDKVSWGES